MRNRKLGRRSLLQFAGAGAASSFWSDETLEGAVQNVNKNSNPSTLKITDLRYRDFDGRADDGSHYPYRHQPGDLRTR